MSSDSFEPLIWLIAGAFLVIIWVVMITSIRDCKAWGRDIGAWQANYTRELGCVAIMPDGTLRKQP